MTSPPESDVAEMPGSLALPRENGELVFGSPWEGRAFGLAVALRDGAVYAWRDFVEQLGAEIVADRRAGGTLPYYRLWLAALEEVLLSKGIVTPEELQAKAAECAALDEHAHEPHSRAHREGAGS